MLHRQYEFDLRGSAPVTGAGVTAAGAVSDPCVPAPSARQRRGSRSHLSGMAAEDAVERDYLFRGLTCTDRRWRCKAGEIDLVFRDGDTVVFVEVKASATHDSAAQRIRPRQADRIASAALVYLDTLAGGGLTDMRIDVALVDGGGAVQVIENAFAGWWH
ncbi:hypothetical protein GCM10011360_03350 [Primorskyibacter flagellatus]|uniref:UPF0102 protein GCM10011360_03350 n=1 Tax=Primorskyibacter flagellatus TaxID=1387277 RepID=A0A917EA76_9RHOB|nr:YraN family protein [Primorskyibacter flagellatus]GGE17877.1 hypothetical protein GCM10011360_03350 [Primorskyibacter flagellatus]